MVRRWRSCPPTTRCTCAASTSPTTSVPNSRSIPGLPPARLWFSTPPIRFVRTPGSTSEPPRSKVALPLPIIVISIEIAMIQKLLLTLPFALASVAWGQVDASISGTVADASGAGLPGATVKVNNVETGAVRVIVTDDAGRYAAVSLVIGSYQVSAEKTGFNSQLRKGIALVVGQHAEVNLTLPVGELRQMLEVEEAPPVVNPTTRDTSGLVGERQVKNLPLNGR